MNPTIIPLFLISFFVQSCISTHSSVQNSSSNQTKRKTLPEIVYLIDRENNGNYKPIEIDEENRPEPIQGNNQWTIDFFGSIKYPAMARVNGIEGVVILDVEIDEKGKVIEVGIKQGVSTECDNEARRAYVYSTPEGYTPLTIDGISTKFRMEVPVGFLVRIREKTNRQQRLNDVLPI